MAITLTAGDTASVITAALTVGGSAYDLTSKTVQAKIRPRNGATILVSCSNVGDPTTGTVSLSLPSNLGAGVYDVVCRDAGRWGGTHVPKHRRSFDEHRRSAGLNDPKQIHVRLVICVSSLVSLVCV